MNYSYRYLVMATQAMVQKQLMEQIKTIGLTSGQPKVLDYLIDHDGASQKEIAKACHIEAGSLTSILNRMEEKGLIERRMLNGNRRTFHIFMTEDGKQKQKLVDETFSKIEEKATNGISKEELAISLKVYEKIYQNLLSKNEIETVDGNHCQNEGKTTNESK